MTIPVANSTDSGYRVYKLNDSLDGTQSIYLKVFFGRAGAATTARTGIQIGRGSDGAGTLVNPNPTSVLYSTNSGLQQALVMHNTSVGMIFARFALALVGAHRWGSVAYPETATADGYHAISQAVGASSVVSVSVDSTNGRVVRVNPYTATLVLVDTANTRLSYGPMRVFACYSWDAVTAQHRPLAGWIGASQGDGPENVPFDSRPWGTTRKWIPIGGASTGPQGVEADANNGRLHAAVN
jgi:hypothetical protein